MDSLPVKSVIDPSNETAIDAVVLRYVKKLCMRLW
jgi:hypothetical protein